MPSIEWRSIQLQSRVWSLLELKRWSLTYQEGYSSKLEQNLTAKSEIRIQMGWGSDSNRGPKYILSLFSSTPQKCLTFPTSPEERRKSIFVSNEYFVN